MTTTDLNLKDAGSLPQPGPIGRLVRLGFGALCLLYVAELWDIRNNPTVSGQISFVLWSGLPVGLYFLNYVVNIGFSQSWKKWPAALRALALVVMAFVSKGLMGEFDGPLVGYALLVLLLYTFAHLGFGFILSAIIGTPGCEMRSFHHLWSLISGKTTKEHICPIGPLTPIDNWESNRQN